MGGDEPPEYHIEDDEEGEQPRPGWTRETLTTDHINDFYHPRLFLAHPDAVRSHSSYGGVPQQEVLSPSAHHVLDDDVFCEDLER